MGLAPITPRDRLQRLVDLARKTLRFWWLVVGFGIVGGAISLAFAVARPRHYESWAVLYYQEQIQTNVLSNRQEEVQRNLGDRFRELLLARAQLAQIIADPNLNAFAQLDGELAVEKLRQAIRFEARGGNNFRITYTDGDAARAKAVTERLTKLLQDKDESLRNDQAQRTVTFVTQKKDEASVELRKREQALAEFLAKHPEFAQDPNQSNGGEGASIRAAHGPKQPATTNTRILALERQRRRIQARLDAPPDAPPIRVAVPPSAEKIAAQAALADAHRELASAKSELEDARGRYTDKHPTVIKAQQRFEAAQQRVRHAEAAVPADTETVIAPATPADRTKLQKELSAIESQIAEEQHADGKSVTASSAAAAESTQRIVDLETEHADLRRQVAEQRDTVSALADSAFRAQIDASQKLAEQGGRLAVVDPAFKPGRPSGPGKTIFLLAGMVLFLGLGGTLAIGLAIIDDRLYRRDDIDQLGIAVLAVIPSATVVHHKKTHA